MNRQVFLDTETTGLSPESGDRVIEIGCIEMVNRRLTGRTLHHYLNPERPNSVDAVRIHGLTDEFLADKPLFASVADEIVEFCAGAEVVIHNAGFDVGFLDQELRRLGRPRFSAIAGAITDSLLMAREMFPGKSNSLDALCRRLEVDNASRTLHGALLDAGLLAEVYIRMTRGQNALVIDEAQAATGEAGARPVDFSAYALVVVGPDAAEEAAHEDVLAQIDKASSGRTVWRSAAAFCASPVPDAARSGPMA